ncbi:MAG: NnrU family protein [Pseudorhodoplanes sp.]|nr:NnrU family protein [Pseudorhodoplanes sp.]
MGLAILVLGLVVFLGCHVFTTLRGERAALVARLGESTYKILYSIVSVVGIALIAWGFAEYRANEWVNVWYPPVWTRHLAALLVWPAMIMLVAAYARGNIYRKLKHPMLAGVKLWALAHLLANGDLGSIVLFGSILAWAVYDRISLKRRTDPGAPPIPVGGMHQDIIAVVGGSVLYVLLATVFHRYVIGVPVFGA